MNSTYLDQISQGKSLDYSAVSSDHLRAQLRDDNAEFRRSGGRGVDLAERIDCARYELRRRSRLKSKRKDKGSKTDRLEAYGWHN